jgi:hypothetical protein
VLGQVYAPLALLVALALEGIAANPVRSAVLIGVLSALKPPFLTWPALLFLQRRHLAAGIALATASVVTIVPIALYGPGIYASWYQTVVGIKWLTAPTNASLPAVLARLGGGPLAPLASIAVLATAAAFARRLPSDRSTAEVAVLAGMLASPLAWPGYLLLILPSMLREEWGAPRLLAACLFCLPCWFVYTHDHAWSFAYPIGLLLLFALRLSEASGFRMTPEAQS